MVQKSGEGGRVPPVEVLGVDTNGHHHTTQEADSGAKNQITREVLSQQ